jgi:hypothetical protein
LGWIVPDPNVSLFRLLCFCLIALRRGGGAHGLLVFVAGAFVAAGADAGHRFLVFVLLSLLFLLRLTSEQKNK